MSYNFETTVNNAEADALKEMIFKRARERAEALDDEVKTSYTSSVKGDVMELARYSFVTPKNPFSSLAETKLEPTKEPETTKKEPVIGFSARKEIASQIHTSNKTSNDTIISNTFDANMSAARSEFTKKEGFMGALDFLNSQASVALIKSRGKTFEAVV